MSHWVGGPPPADSPRRCIARSRRTGEQCKRWALRERPYCQFHGGRRYRSGAYRVNGRMPGSVGWRRCMGMYGRYLAPKLSDALREMVARPHEELLSIYEEIGIARLGLAQVLVLAQPVLDGTVQDPKMKALALEMLREQTEHVCGLVKTAADIEKSADDKYSVKTLGLFVMQIMHACYEVLGDQPEKVKQLARVVDDYVRLPMEGRRPVLDAQAELTRFDRDRKLLEAMDNFTAPRDPEAPVVQPVTLQDCGGGPALGEDGAGEASPGESAEGEEAVG